MEALEQAELVRQFMLAICPEITRHTLRTIEKQIDNEYFAAGRNLAESPNEEHVAFLRDAAAQQASYMTLRWAMHLAAQFARLQTTLHETKDSIEKAIAAETIQRESAGAAG